MQDLDQALNTRVNSKKPESFRLEDSTILNIESPFSFKLRKVHDFDCYKEVTNEKLDYS